MDYLNVVLWVLTVSVALLSMQSHKALGFHQKYINLGSEDDWKSYGLYIIYYLLYKNIKYSVGGGDIFGHIMGVLVPILF